MTRGDAMKSNVTRDEGNCRRRPAAIGNRPWRLALAIAVLSAFAVARSTAADEPFFPGPRAKRPYEQPPRMLAADPLSERPKTRLPNGGTLTLQVGPKPEGKPEPAAPSNVPVDKPYKPSSITDIAVDVAEKPGVTDPTLPMIRYTPREIAAQDPAHYSSQPVVLTRLNGAFVDQRMSGPVAPFCFLPTYFEDDSLTRFGYSHGEHLQPVLSAAQFYVSVLMLPYQMEKRCPCDPVCPNYLPPPLTFKEKARKFTREITVGAVASEAAAVATVFLVFP
jgi:hypothetical protein